MKTTDGKTGGTTGGRTGEEKQPRIAVVGGGIGGLALAGMLHRQGIAATVYERDAHAGARTQGGTLDLHPESGRRALDELGLTEAFRAEARPEGRSCGSSTRPAAHWCTVSPGPKAAAGRRSTAPSSASC
ncbi:FAD-dependent monooxygenase [Streptomyces mexicanus]